MAIYRSYQGQNLICKKLAELLGKQANACDEYIAAIKERL